MVWARSDSPKPRNLLLKGTAGDIHRHSPRSRGSSAAVPNRFEVDVMLGDQSANLNRPCRHGPCRGGDVAIVLC